MPICVKPITKYVLTNYMHVNRFWHPVLAGGHRYMFVPTCFQAYHVGLYGAKIVWIFPGWYSTKFWTVESDDSNCTVSQMEQVVEGAFLTAPIFRNVKEQRGAANITGRDAF